MPTLLKAQKMFKKTPQALLDMPILDPYLEELVSHFNVLSRSRSYYAEVTPTPKGGMVTTRRPNPIDISTILDYNHSIARVLKDEVFLSIIQTLDHLFMMSRFKK